MDDLRSMIKVRGLQEGFQATPLRKFWGTLAKYDGVTDPKYNRLNVVLSFTDVEVLVSTEPYEFPIAELRIGHNNRTDSNWGVFAASVAKFIPEDQDGLDPLLGKRVLMEITPGHMMWNREKGERTPRDCWECVDVQGMSAGGGSAATKLATSPKATAISLLDGSTDQEFMQKALRHEAIKAEPNWVNNILNRSFINEMVSKGVVTQDSNGKYVVDPMAAARALTE